MSLRFGDVRGALAALLLTFAPPASAATNEVVLSGGAPVRIWKSQAMMEQGRDLLASSAEPDANALAPLLACEVAPGTRAIVSRMEGSYAWQAEVTDGPKRGCRGIVGPRDFKTEGELAPRPPAAPRADVAPAPGPTGPSDRRMILWYQVTFLGEDGRARTAWKPVAGWETEAQCDSARHRLTEADDRELSALLDRLGDMSQRSRTHLTMTRVPRVDAIELEMSWMTGGVRHSGRLEVQSHCFSVQDGPER